MNRFEGKKDNYPGYSIWGVAITEVEVDILTGEMYIVRSDVLEDAGLSTSPIVISQFKDTLFITFTSRLTLDRLRGPLVWAWDCGHLKK